MSRKRPAALSGGGLPLAEGSRGFFRKGDMAALRASVVRQNGGS